VYVFCACLVNASTIENGVSGEYRKLGEWQPIFYCHIAAQSTPHQICSISSSPAAHLALFVGILLAFLAVIYLYG
jgi:hypothetical protein